MPNWGCVSECATDQEPRKTTHQTPAEEHDRDRDMLKILCSPSTAPGRQMLKEDIGAAVEKYDERFRELGGWYGRAPTSDDVPCGLHVPRPTKVCERAHPSTQGQ